MRRSVAVMTWGVVTVVVCAVAWTAVDRVGADVTDHPTVVGNGAIREELSPRAGAAVPGLGADPGASPATTPDGAPAGSGTGDGGAASPGGATTGTEGTTPGATPSGGGAGGAGRHATGGGNVGGTPTTTTAPPAPPPTTTPPPTNGPESSVVTAGGSVTAACTNGTPQLVRAVPNAGYGVVVRPNGNQVVVTLRSGSHDSVVEIECEGTRVHFSTSEEPGD